MDGSPAGESSGNGGETSRVGDRRRCAKPSRPPGSKGKPPKTNGVLRVAERSVTLESTGSVIRRLSDDVEEDNNMNNTSTTATQVDFSVNATVQAEVSNYYAIL
ncbi:hypothetical protein EZV62_007972 [Acer yangbiense]|uniref:Uncharacterized protein n=1 Tax=Acer yangbiense TaxID=1000413 RepID=A0A5C7IBU1_9ROSI|nr:hypothetical protein EZV62_007972 [Acer yangbiense]